MQPFHYRGVLHYLVFVDKKLGIYIYDRYIKLLGVGLNVKKGEDFWKKTEYIYRFLEIVGDEFTGVEYGMGADGGDVLIFKVMNM